jgi:hypothetical protein
VQDLKAQALLEAEIVGEEDRLGRGAHDPTEEEQQRGEGETGPAVQGGHETEQGA